MPGRFFGALQYIHITKKEKRHQYQIKITPNYLHTSQIMSPKIRAYSSLIRGIKYFHESLISKFPKFHWGVHTGYRRLITLFIWKYRVAMVELFLFSINQSKFQKQCTLKSLCHWKSLLLQHFYLVLISILMLLQQK